LDDDGDIHDEVQGESFDEDGKQVGLDKLDKLDKVADQIFDWRENMPALFEDGWGERDGKSALLQHREIRFTATPSDSHHFCFVLLWVTCPSSCIGCDSLCRNIGDSLNCNSE
jgi:hypothetical protein